MQKMIIRRYTLIIYFSLLSYFGVCFILGYDFPIIAQSYYNYVICIITPFILSIKYMLNCFSNLSVLSNLFLLIISFFFYIFVEWLLLSFVVFNFFIVFFNGYRAYMQEHPKIKWLTRFIFILGCFLLFLFSIKWEHDFRLLHNPKGFPRLK